jgi:SAM-dependent methyltransferase
MTVLDAACGVGAWSISMAGNVEAVVAVDRNPARLQIGELLKRVNRVRNVEFVAGDLHDLPARCETFDLVICYSALMFVRAGTVIRELSRVLKPGGRMYISANGLGWYLFEGPWRAIVNRRFIDLKASALYVLRTYAKWLSGRDLSHTAFRRSEVVKLLMANGLVPVAICDEGCAPIGALDAMPRPAYRGRYLGVNGVFDVIAQKPTPRLA